MKKLVILLPLVLLSLAACEVRKTGDIKDINTYNTVIYCDKGSASVSVCRNCTNWYSVNAEQIKTAQSVTCESLGSSHVHYVVTWVNN